MHTQTANSQNQSSNDVFHRLFINSLNRNSNDNVGKTVAGEKKSDPTNSIDNSTNVDEGIDALTGLPLTSQFYYALKLCILLQDDKWVLAMLNIDNLKKLNESFGYQKANLKIAMIGKMIADFCDNNPYRLKGFRNNDDGKGDLFGVLLYCQKDTSFAQRNMQRLIKKMFDKTNVTVSVGITAMKKSKNFTFIQWRQNTLNCIKIAKQNGGNQVYVDTTIDKSKISDNDKHSGGNGGALSSEALFNSKTKEIANNQNTNWILAIIDGDNVGAFKNKNGIEATGDVMNDVGFQIIKICNVFENTCFGYKLGSGDEFGMIIYDKNIDDNDDVSSTFSSRDIIQMLLENVRYNCKLTVSVGYTRLSTDELKEEWFDRANEYLTVAKRNGKNQAYWGQKLKRVQSLLRRDSASSDSNKIEDNNEDAYYAIQSLKEVE